MGNIRSEIQKAQAALMPYIEYCGEKPPRDLSFGEFNMVCLYLLNQSPSRTILCEGSSLYESFLSIGIDDRYEMMAVFVSITYVDLHACVLN